MDNIFIIRFEINFRIYTKYLWYTFISRTAFEVTNSSKKLKTRISDISETFSRDIIDRFYLGKSLSLLGNPNKKVMQDINISMNIIRFTHDISMQLFLV